MAYNLGMDAEITMRCPRCGAVMKKDKDMFRCENCGNKIPTDHGKQDDGE